MQVTDLKGSLHSNNGKQIDPEGIFIKRYEFILYRQLSLHLSLGKKYGNWISSLGAKIAKLEIYMFSNILHD